MPEVLHLVSSLPGFCSSSACGAVLDTCAQGGLDACCQQLLVSFREQAAAVNDFRQEVQNMPFWPTLPRNTSASGGPALIHPVWGSSTADNRQRQELLLLLLRSEAERLTVWASPRDVLDADNRIHLSQTSDQDWGRHLLTAWDCDQRLALCLLEHYPAISAVRRELEALVLQHADDPALQELPEAALLLATPGAVSRNAPQLTNLAVWAVCPLLQAMALMAGPAGAQPAVRAYCIRSLQATKPEEVSNTNTFEDQAVVWCHANEAPLSYSSAWLITSGQLLMLGMKASVCAGGFLPASTGAASKRG